MADLLPILGSLGGGGTLVAVIIYLLTSNRADRAAANDRIDAANRRADEAEARTRQVRLDEDAALKRAQLAEGIVARQALPAAHPDPTAPPSGENVMP